MSIDYILNMHCFLLRTVIEQDEPRTMQDKNCEILLYMIQSLQLLPFITVYPDILV